MAAEQETKEFRGTLQLGSMQEGCATVIPSSSTMRGRDPGWQMGNAAGDALCLPSPHLPAMLSEHSDTTGAL